ncbi:hypothetical protein PsorP6_013934 [Peronosclerospora sorghi]|uniref:Uncharacterized protein n=1 Tax=Peronosclerospora sorghi TaxID=230839 RepID=A0ACC0VGC4_9STRA|nr:hypothetical protein PsorP6_013934 [Peronosclerospora sorghi]
MKYWCGLLQLLGSGRLIQSIDSSTRRSSERARIFSNPKPVFDICNEFGLNPSDVLVLVRHAPTIQAAKYALIIVYAFYICRSNLGMLERMRVIICLAKTKYRTTQPPPYHITRLKEYRDLIENSNGVSYRDKIQTGSIEF